MITFSIDKLKKEDIYLEGEAPPSFLEVPDSEMIAFKGNIHYKLHAALISGGILVKGSASAGYEGLCGRCLEKFRGEFGNPDICLFFDKFEGAELDVTEDIRTALVLEIPMNCICREDCRGLCHQCGTNLNKTKCNCQETAPGYKPWDKLNDLKL
ncbi:MAG: DUF177 domain-containing protein [Victivallaceae bacterium]|nr:DUF177 domain-containing protein [Victivallaceae bacterium]